MNGTIFLHFLTPAGAGGSQAEWISFNDVHALIEPEVLAASSVKQAHEP